MNQLYGRNGESRKWKKVRLRYLIHYICERGCADVCIKYMIDICDVKSLQLPGYINEKTTMTTTTTTNITATTLRNKNEKSRVRQEWEGVSAFFQNKYHFLWCTGETCMVRWNNGHKKSWWPPIILQFSSWSLSSFGQCYFHPTVSVQQQYQQDNGLNFYSLFFHFSSDGKKNFHPLFQYYDRKKVLTKNKQRNLTVTQQYTYTFIHTHKPTRK